MGASSSTARPEDDFETVRELGRGSFGVVSLVRKRGAPSGCAALLYAHKEISFGGWFTASSEAEVKAEAAILQSLDHPNVVRLRSMWTSRGYLKCTAHMIMDYCVYGSARALAPFKLLENEPPGLRASTTMCHQFAIDVMSGLEYLHRRGVVHRDIKLCNILVDVADGCETRSSLSEASAHEVRFCLADFGVSVAIRAAESNEKVSAPYVSVADRAAIARAGNAQASGEALHSVAQTAAKTRCGTLLYMAPEVLKGGRTYGGEVDVYAAGVALREVLEGVPVYSIPGFNLQRQATTGALHLQPFLVRALLEGPPGSGWPGALLVAALGLALTSGWPMLVLATAATAAATLLPAKDAPGSLTRVGLHLLSGAMTARRQFRPPAATCLVLARGVEAWPFVALALAAALGGVAHALFRRH